MKNASQPRSLVVAARRPDGAPKANPPGSHSAAPHAPNKTAAKPSEEMGWRLPAPLLDLVSYSPNVSRPGNWLYGHKTTNCDARGALRWDNKPETLLSRVLLPLGFCAILVAICRMGFDSREQALRAAADSATENNGVQRQEHHERRWHLDFARIVCVACVVTEHSGGSTYTKHNVGFVLQWILPFFWLTSGACFMMSNASTQAYIGRLSLLLLVGVGANWIADLSTGRDWQRNFGDTIFQMFYVVALMVLSVICEPLRRALKWRKTSQNPPQRYMIVGSTFFWCSLTLLGFAYFVRGKDMVELNSKNESWFYYKQDVVRHFSLIMIQVCGMLFLGLIATLIGSNEKLGWYLLAMIFVPRVIIPWNQVGFAHNVELFILAMVLEAFPLKGHKQIASWFSSYWPIVFVFLLLMCFPEMVGRCDLLPPETYWERSRFYGIELILVTLFVTGSFKMSDPWKCTGWLSYWALYAYCFHIFWARVVPEPYGAVITYSHIAVFYALSKFYPRYFRGPHGSEDDNKPPKMTCET